MNKIKTLALLLFVGYNLTCLGQEEEIKSDINKEGNIIETRFDVPNGFVRVPVNNGSFEQYLRELPLKEDGAEVVYYDGNTKENYNIYSAVVDLPIGTRDLHQCADAVMRVRAEYLWNNEKYDQIHFNFTNGMRVDYTNWMNGERIRIKGNNTNWYQATNPSNSYRTFWKYMEIIFSYAGTYSLERELYSKDIENINIGDVFIQGGFPGHAIIVVDVIKNNTSGEKRFLLAQSYMPAQELQVLVNPSSEENSSWYSANFSDKLDTPEWTFYKSDLKSF